MTIAFLVPPFSTHPTFSRTVAVTRPSVQRVSRRHVLRVVAGVVLVAPFVTQGEEIDPRKYVNGQVSLDQFRVLLENGDIDRVWFYGAFNEYCVFRLKKDAAIKYIGQGYPTEDARSNQSPLQVMAKVRDYGVEYSTNPFQPPK